MVTRDRSSIELKQDFGPRFRTISAWTVSTPSNGVEHLMGMASFTMVLMGNFFRWRFAGFPFPPQ